MKIKQLIIILSLALVVLLSACTAASPAATGTFQRTINVSSTGKVYLAPDIAYVVIGVHTESDNVSTSLSDNSQQAAAIASTLGELGVAAEDIQTSAFNVYPYEAYSPMGESLGTKYAVDNTVFVTVRNLGNLGQVLDSVVRAGANTINSIQFDVANKEEAISEARKLAIESAKAQAEEIAQAAGIELGGLVSLSTYGSDVPAPVYDTYGKGGMSTVMQSEVPVAAGQMVISIEASMTYEIK